MPNINSDTNPRPPIVNVVCQYLRQFIGARFGFATLYPAALIRGEGPDLYLQIGPFWNLQKFF